MIPRVSAGQLGAALDAYYTDYTYYDDYTYYTQYADCTHYSDYTYRALHLLHVPRSSSPASFHAASPSGMTCDY